MAESNFRGPLYNMGSLEDTSSSPFDGPSLSYQGLALPDPRISPTRKDGTQPARVPSFYLAPNVVACDLIPMIGTNNLIATTSLYTTPTPMTLIATALGGADNNVASIAPGMPLIPFNQTAIVTVMALDFGFATGTTTASSSTVVVTDSSFFRVGAWYAIGGAGNAGKTAGLITQLTSIGNLTTVYISPVAAGSLTRAPIGNANAHGTLLTPPATQFGPSAVVGNSVSPYVNGGLSLLFDPTQGASRTLSIRTTDVTTGTATIVVNGYDIFGVPMSETLTGNGTTAFGKKAFKYISSCVPSTTSVTATSFIGIGISDAFGFPVRADKGQYISACYGTTFLTSTNGFTAAALGTATSTTGDVRGTLQISTAGPLGTSLVAPLINGTSRLVMSIDVPMNNMIFATANNTVPLFGWTQA